MLFTLNANAVTELAALSVKPGQMVSVDLDRRVSPNAVSARPLNLLTNQTKVIVTFEATKDGIRWYQIASSDIIGGNYSAVNPSTGKTVTLNNSGMSVNAVSGETEIRVMAQMVTASVVSAAGCGINLAVN